MEKVYAGLVGLGNFGEIIAKIINGLPNVQLTAISSRSISRMEEFGAKYNVKNHYLDYGQMCHDSNIDAIFITSEAKFHAEQAISAIRNKKHVFLEKPIALDYQDAEKIIKEAKINNVFLMVGYLLRFDTRHAILKQFIDDGRFGEIAYMSFKRSFSRKGIKDSGNYTHPVYETMTHDIDLALWYAKSEVSKIYAAELNVAKKNIPDACFATASFKNGIIATFETNWLIPDGSPVNLFGMNQNMLASRFDAVGTKMISKIEIELLDPGFYLIDDNSIYQPVTGLRDEAGGKINGALNTEINHFVDCVMNNKASLIASAEDALYTMKIVDAILESASTGREVNL